MITDVIIIRMYIDIDYNKEYIIYVILRTFFSLKLLERNIMISCDTALFEVYEEKKVIIRF